MAARVGNHGLPLGAAWLGALGFLVYATAHRSAADVARSFLPMHPASAAVWIVVLAMIGILAGRRARGDSPARRPSQSLICVGLGVVCTALTILFVA